MNELFIKCFSDVQILVIALPIISSSFIVPIIVAFLVQFIVVIFILYDTKNLPLLLHLKYPVLLLYIHPFISHIDVNIIF
jgi:hypothetical protein